MTYLTVQLGNASGDIKAQIWPDAMAPWAGVEVGRPVAPVPLLATVVLLFEHPVTFTSAIRGSSPRWLPSPPPSPDAI